MNGLRKKPVTVTAEGRDKGKTFLIEELPALQAERWATRAGLIIKGNAAAIPDDIARFGFTGIAIRLINGVLSADIDPDAFLPMWDELLRCVKIIRDPRHPDVATDVNWELNDVMEIATVFWLRMEVLSIHINFSIVDEFWTWWASKTAEFAHQDSSNTPTSLHS